jgi:hypothetical protein
VPFLRRRIAAYDHRCGCQHGLQPRSRSTKCSSIASVLLLLSWCSAGKADKQGKSKPAEPVSPWGKTVGSDDDVLDPETKKRRDEIKEAMVHAWSSYETYAWGFDELQVRSVVLLIHLCATRVVLYPMPVLSWLGLLGVSSRVFLQSVLIAESNQKGRNSTTQQAAVALACCGAFNHLYCLGGYSRDSGEVVVTRGSSEVKCNSVPFCLTR